MKSILVSMLSATIIAIAASSNAQTLLSVDFNTGSSPTETGFQDFDEPSASGGSLTFGAYTVTVFGPVTSRDRGAFNTIQPGYDNTELVQDLITSFNHTNGDANTDTPSSTAFSVSGLDANTSYNMRIWALDKGNNNPVKAGLFDMNTSGGPSLIGDTITSSNSTTSPSDNNAFSTFGEVITDGTGTLNIGYVANFGSTGNLNGFELSVVPEPSTFVLLAGALAFGVVARRRRHHS